jgi:biotin carboxyl carrier protein
MGKVMSNTYRAKVNGKGPFEITMGQAGFQYQGKDYSTDLVQINGDTYHLLLNNSSFEVTLLEVLYDEKIFRFSLEGEELEVHVEDEFDAMVKKMGLSAQAGQKMNEIKAPMPGLILDVHVQEGDAVEESGELLTIEAMKMENKLTTSSDVVVKEIHVSKGDKVDKNQVLISFE